MKTQSKLYHSSAIIKQMISHDRYKPLKNLFYCQDFLRLMSPMHQNLIEKIFIKNTLLTIITKNPSGYQELNHDNTKKSIKFLIKIYAKENPLSPFTQIEEIKIFSKRYFSEPKIINSIKQNTYLELSNGEFVNHCKDPILFQKFENLRKAIKKCLNKN